jgi:hypothetical protein
VTSQGALVNISLALFVFSLLLGLSVMLGWCFDVRRLIQVVPGFVPMQFNTALLLTCLAGAGLTAALRLHRITQGLCLFSFLFAGATLLQYVTQQNFGIDEFFHSATVTDRTYHPGRMSPNTGACYVFIAVGMCLTMVHQKWAAWLASGCFSVAAGLSLISLVGYAFGIKPLIAWGGWTQMAVHTSVGILFLAAGAICLLASRSHFKMGKLPEWMPLVLLVLSLSVVVSLRQGYSTMESDAAHARTTEELDWVASRFVDEFNDEFYPLRIAAERLSESTRWNAHEWKSEASLLVGRLTGLDRLAMVQVKEDQIRILGTYPDVSQSPTELDRIQESVMLPQAIAARISLQEKSSLNLVDIADIEDAPDLWLLCAIDNAQAANQRFIWADLNLAAVLEYSFQRADAKYWINLSIEEEVIFTNVGKLAMPMDDAAKREINVGGRVWVIQLLDRNFLSETSNIMVGHLILGAGTLSSVLLALSLYLAMSALQRASEVEQILTKSNHQLQQAIIKAPMPMFVYSGTGTIKQYSDSWHQSCGRHYVGQGVNDWLKSSHAVDQANLQELSLDTLREYSGLLELVSESGKNYIGGRIPVS